MKEKRRRIKFKDIVLLRRRKKMKKRKKKINITNNYNTKNTI
jgi:hypothetical protein